VLLAAVAAVLAPEKVVFVNTADGAVVQTAALPGRGIAIFAAPDRRVVVPLRDEDATAVVSPSGSVERWAGRVFPLFSSEYDRMDVILPGVLVTLSYPERLPLIRVPLEGVPGAVRAACSEDGRVVALIPSDSGGRTLVVVAAMEGGTAETVRLARQATTVVMADDSGVAVTASGDALEAAALGEMQARPALRVGGDVRSLCRLPPGGVVLAGLELGRTGAVVGIRVDPKARQPLRELFRTPLPAPVVALAALDEDIVAVSGDEVAVLARKGRRVARTCAVPGAYDVTLLPRTAQSTVPRWGDAALP
jgi:hypothetical protein